MKWRMPAVTVKRSISKLLGMVLVVTKPSVSCVSIALSSQNVLHNCCLHFEHRHPILSEE